MTRKNTSLPILISISDPSTESFMAIDDNTTIITTANRSSTISTASTCDANFCWRRPISVNALMIVVVEDIDIIPPRNRLLMKLKSRIYPTMNPAHHSCDDDKGCNNGRHAGIDKLLETEFKSSENNSTTISNLCPKVNILEGVDRWRQCEAFGLARNPATI